MEIIQKFIKSLRDKPDHHKEGIAFYSALIITVFVFAGWVNVFMSNLNGSAIASTREYSMNDEVSPFSNLKRVGKDFFESVDSIRNGGVKVWQRASGQFELVSTSSDSIDQNYPSVLSNDGGVTNVR